MDHSMRNAVECLKRKINWIHSIQRDQGKISLLFSNYLLSGFVNNIHITPEFNEQVNTFGIAGNGKTMFLEHKKISWEILTRTSSTQKLQPNARKFGHNRLWIQSIFSLLLQS
jgi:hypothetical protein